MRRVRDVGPLDHGPLLKSQIRPLRPPSERAPDLCKTRGAFRRWLRCSDKCCHGLGCGWVNFCFLNRCCVHLNLRSLAVATMTTRHSSFQTSCLAEPNGVTTIALKFQRFRNGQLFGVCRMRRMSFSATVAATPRSRRGRRQWLVACESH